MAALTLIVGLCRSVGSIFFVCQAEDGIRALYVTGVQTCALPISPASTPAAKVSFTCEARLAASLSRSEERRVGKGVDLGGRRVIKKKKEQAKRYLGHLDLELVEVRQYEHYPVQH